MGLIQEASEMVERGTRLVAREVLMWGTGEVQVGARPTILQRVSGVEGDVRYEVIDFRHEPGGHVLVYENAYAAASALKRTVGGAALSRALSELRYAHLFPNGSSLEWPAQPTPMEVRVTRRIRAA